MKEDFYGPTLLSVEFLSVPKEKLVAGDDFTIKYNAYDPAGIMTAWIYYYCINEITGSIKPIQVIDEDLDGILNFKVNSEYWADGKYSFMYVTLIDKLNNRVTYTNTGVINGAIQGLGEHDFNFKKYDVNVSNPGADVYGPVLNGFDISSNSTKPFTIGDKVTIKYDATDASGLSFISFNWWWTDPLYGTARSKEFKDDDFDGVIEFTIGETPDMYGSKEWYPGTYRLFYVQMHDKAFSQVNQKNITGYNYGGILNGDSIARTHDFDYSLYDINIPARDVDRTGPTIEVVSSNYSPAANKEFGDELKIYYEAIDQSGLSMAVLTFAWTNPITGKEKLRDQYDEDLNGVFEIVVDESWEIGDWRLLYFNVSDNNPSSSDRNRVGYTYDGIINGPSVSKTHAYDFQKFNFKIVPTDDSLESVRVAATFWRDNTKTLTETKKADAVNLTDAIAILKMIVGLSVNSNGAPLSPYQSIAADFDQSGGVDLTDAIGVLKAIVGLSAPTPAWKYYDDAKLTSAYSSTQSLNPKVWTSGALIPDTTAVDAGVKLIGVLTGDVDGSWTGV
jgi:hypothetical protein